MGGAVCPFVVFCGSCSWSFVKGERWREKACVSFVTPSLCLNSGRKSLLEYWSCSFCFLQVLLKCSFVFVKILPHLLFFSSQHARESIVLFSECLPFKDFHRKDQMEFSYPPVPYIKDLFQIYFSLWEFLEYFWGILNFYKFPSSVFFATETLQDMLWLKRTSLSFGHSIIFLLYTANCTWSATATANPETEEEDRMTTKFTSQYGHSLRFVRSLCGQMFQPTLHFFFNSTPRRPLLCMLALLVGWG